MKVPFLREGWRQIEPKGVLLAFEDEAHQAVIALFRSCGEGKRLPLKILARRLFFGLKEKRILEQRPIMLNGSKMLHTVIQAEFEGDEVMVSSYVAKGGACIYDLVYLAPPSSFEAKLSDFERFVQGWELREGRR